jgi:hypothetical protein
MSEIVFRARPVSSWRQRDDYEGEVVYYDSLHRHDRQPITPEELEDLPLLHENEEELRKFNDAGF